VHIILSILSHKSTKNVYIFIHIMALVSYFSAKIGLSERDSSGTTEAGERSEAREGDGADSPTRGEGGKADQAEAARPNFLCLKHIHLQRNIKFFKNNFVFVYLFIKKCDICRRILRNCLCKNSPTV
jgi:hypothetical protein